MLRVLRNTSATLYQAFYEDETETPADGAVTVTITKDVDGSTVISGTASPDGNGGYTFLLPAQSGLGPLTATWAGTFSGNAEQLQSPIEVVGNRLFTIAEVRALDTAFADTAAFPSDLIDLHRTVIEYEFEKITGESFIPRFKRVSDSNPAMWDRVIRVLGRGGADLTGWNPFDSIRDWDEYGPAVDRDVYTDYEYGFANVPPEVHREALNYVAVLLRKPKSAIPDRAASFVATDGGMFTLATPGRAGYETGIPSVDAVLARYPRTTGAIY